MRWLCVAAGLVVLPGLAGCSSGDGTSSAPDPAVSSSGASTSASGAPGRPGECTTDTLSASLAPQQGGGTAGSFYSTILLSDTGDAPCVLQGFGGVSYVGRGARGSGQQVGESAERTDETATPIVLQPGDQAGQQVRETDFGDYDRARCRPTPVAGIRVYPPDSTTSLFLAHPTTGCAGKGVSLLAVGPYAPLE